MYKSVLVPVDLSHTERLMPMLNQADALCASDGQISVVHIVPALPHYISADLPRDFYDNGERAAGDALAKLVREAQIDARIIVRSGSVANRCLDVAKEIEADLIVIASHDPGLSDYFLGSTAARVVRHAHCSVLVMR